MPRRERSHWRLDSFSKTRGHWSPPFLRFTGQSMHGTILRFHDGWSMFAEARGLPVRPRGRQSSDSRLLFAGSLHRPVLRSPHRELAALHATSIPLPSSFEQFLFARSSRRFTGSSRGSSLFYDPRDRSRSRRDEDYDDLEDSMEYRECSDLSSSGFQVLFETVTFSRARACPRKGSYLIYIVSSICSYHDVVRNPGDPASGLSGEPAALLLHDSRQDLPALGDSVNGG